MDQEYSEFTNSSCSHHLNLKRLFDVKPLIKFYQCRNEVAFVRLILEESERDLLRELHRIRPMLAVFLCLIALGAVGNALVVCAAARGVHVRTVTNVLILNLAISDFVLCAVTQPFNIRRLFFPNYSWESGLALCKMVNALTGVNLFVSTFSVTAIALDRCRVVLQATPSGPANRGCHLALLAIWLGALLLASPLLWFAEIAQDETWLSGARKACVERTASQSDKALKVAYSGATIFLQYATPLAVLTCAFVRIRARLARRLRAGHRNSCCCSLTPLQRMRRRIEKQRQRRANALLASGAALFGLSWLPLSVFNLLHDVKLWQIDVHDHMDFVVAEGRIRDADLGFSVFIAQGICLLCVLASACINPILYGFFNDNFHCQFGAWICCWQRRGAGEAALVAQRRPEQNDQDRDSPPLLESSL